MFVGLVCWFALGELQLVAVLSCVVSSLAMRFGLFVFKWLV